MAGRGISREWIEKQFDNFATEIVKVFSKKGHKHTKSDISDFPTIPTVSDTYSSSSGNAMSGKAVASAIGGKTNDTTAGANALINRLSVGSSTPVDDDYYVSQYVKGGTTTTTYHRRPMSALWNYIKGKIDAEGYTKTDTKNASSLTCTSGKYGGTTNTTVVQTALNNLSGAIGNYLVSGSQTSSSDEDEGSNTFTFTKADGSLGGTFTVKNGSKGSPGNKIHNLGECSVGDPYVQLNEPIENYNLAQGDILIFTNGRDAYIATYKQVAQASIQLIDTYGFTKLVTSGETERLPLAGGTMTGTIITPGNNSKGIEPTTNGYGCVGQSNKRYYCGYINNMYMSSIMSAGSSTTGGIYYTSGVLRPMKDGGTTLGNSTYKWGQIWSTNASISTSDRNMKKNIKPINEDKWVDFFTKIQPVSYVFKDGTSGRNHIGFISQDIEKAMEECEIDSLEFAGFCKDKKQEMYMEEVDEQVVNEDGKGVHVERVKKEVYKDVLDEKGEPIYIYSLRYEEFIALNTMMIQRVYSKNCEFEERLRKLEQYLPTMK